MAKKHVYMVLDCETATLPFAMNYSGEQRKKIAIAKPLPYNMGWLLMYRNGEVFRKRNFLVSEIFSVPSVFNTAYYADKRPLYLEQLANGEIILATWEQVAQTLMEDLEEADFVGAYNAMFDFCKAIPFMELYIKKLYSPDYYRWEKMQSTLCEKIVNNGQKQKVGINTEIFSFRGIEKPIFDIWGMSCEYLLNNWRYKEMCLNHDMVSNSGEFFKTSAEAAYRYLCEKYDFDEAHTAIEDSIIESELLAKILRQHKVTLGISPFPFRTLGYTDDFVMNAPNTRKKQYAEKVYYAFERYLPDESYECMTTYEKKIYHKKENMYRIFMEE